MAAAGYAGDLGSREAWDVLKNDPGAVLVDVRTVPEWQFVGAPDLATLGKTLVTVSWQVYPHMQFNLAFADELRARGVDKDATVLLICRSGARSRDAAIALTGLGFTRCYNVADGFEGPPDEGGRRGRRAGWKASDLPWRQA